MFTNQGYILLVELLGQQDILESQLHIYPQLVPLELQF